MNSKSLTFDDDVDVYSGVASVVTSTTRVHSGFVACDCLHFQHAGGWLMTTALFVIVQLLKQTLITSEYTSLGHYKYTNMHE